MPESRARNSDPMWWDADAFVRSIARTNLQLYIELAAQCRVDSDLVLIRRAYDLAARLYSGAYQADGKPFVTHLVSVASALALLGLPSNIVATGLLHNVYTNADFGDGLHRRVTAHRRRQVVDAVGEEVDSLIRRFAEIRLDRNLDSLSQRVPAMSESDKSLVTIDLVDVLEKHLDSGVLFYGQADWAQGFAARNVEELCGLARAVGYPVLGVALRSVIETVGRSSIPHVLKSDPDKRYLYFVAPPSLRRKSTLTVLHWLRTLRFRLAQRVKRLLPGGAA